MEVDSEFVEKNLEYYPQTRGLAPNKLEEYGQEYRRKGFLTRKQLYEVAFMSSARSAYHVKKNSESRCKEVASDLLRVEGDFSSMVLLCSLNGFKTPTGSCVLAALNPERHAVVDTRVWASLERLDYFDERKEVFNPHDYIKMIEPLREIAEGTGFKASDVGYALFAYDDRVREGNLH